MCFFGAKVIERFSSYDKVPEINVKVEDVLVLKVITVKLIKWGGTSST